MRHPILSALLVTSGFVLSTLCATAAAEDSISVLGRSWQVGNSAQDESQQLTEYVLPGEAVENWSALVSHQYIHDPDAKLDLGRLLKLIRGGFPAECINFDWSVVRKNRTEALYTWKHDGCANARAEAERSLLKRVRGGLCRWSYATRVDPLDTLNIAQLDADLARLPCEGAPQPTTSEQAKPGHMRFQIAGVGPMDLPMSPGGPRSVADGAMKIEMAGFLVGKSQENPQQASLIWTFGFTNKSLKNVRIVKVEEVSPSEAGILRVEDPSPSFRDKYWSGASRPEVATPENHPWLYSKGPSLFVFRFTVHEQGKEPRVLYQPTVFSPEAKQHFRAQIAKLNGG